MTRLHVVDVETLDPEPPGKIIVTICMEPADGAAPLGALFDR